MPIQFLLNYKTLYQFNFEQSKSIKSYIDASTQSTLSYPISLSLEIIHTVLPDKCQNGNNKIKSVDY